MTSRNRDIAKSIGQAVKNDTITATGELSGVGGSGVTAYASVDNLPTSGNDSGDQAFVSGNNRLYIWNGSGWYNIALINTNPSFDSNGTPESTYELDINQAVTTITLLATDPEGLNVTYTATTDSDFDGLGTVSQDSSVFTITPKSSDSATTTSGSITFKASDGVNIASAISTFTLIFSIENSNFTSILIKTSGNNGTNTTINDASSNTHAITVNGNATAQAFTPHHPGGYSTHFDGTGDYLKTPSSADFNLSSTAFTIEGWFYATAPAGNEHIWSSYIDTNNRESLYFTNSTTLNWWANGSTRISATVAANNWYHFAIVDDNGTTTFYLNGVSQGTWSSTYTDGNRLVWLGTYNDGGVATDSFTGYLSDIRYVKGTAVYTADFTSPTERLTAITNTKLLTCHLPYIADGSDSAHTITVAGNTHTERLGPYEYSSYRPSSNGASVYFDGTGDYLTAAHDTTLEISSSDMTLEAWCYPTSTNNGHIIGKRSAGGNYGGYAIYWSSSKFGALIDTDTSTPWAVSLLTTETFPINTWYHVVFTRNGNNCYLYVNGVQKATTSFTGTANTNSSTLFSVGAIGNGDQPLTGFVSDARLVKGTAVYTSAFTPPTSPLSAITNTSLLTCNDTANVFDASGRTRVSLESGIKSSTSSTKYNSSNIQIDASSGQGQIHPIGKTTFDDITGDLTFETWVKLDSSAQEYATLFYYADAANTGNPHITLRFGDSGFGYHLQFNVYSSGQSNVYSVNLTQSDFTSNFRHVALVRTDGIWRIFVDGTQRNFNSGADPSTFTMASYTQSGTLANIDTAKFGSANFDGNLEDIRFTPGISRYPFIPAKETLTTDSNTQFLTGHASTITDGSGNDHSITVSGATVSTFAPKSGMYSISFDGSNDYVRADTALDWDAGAGQNFTIDGWVYFDTIGTTFESIVGINKASGGANHLVFGADDPDGFIILWNGSAVQLTGVPSNTGEWYHFAIVYTGTVFKIFINGAFAFSSTDTTSTRLQDCTLLLGAEADASNAGTRGNYLDGYISNFRIRSGAQYTENFTPPSEELSA